MDKIINHYLSESEVDYFRRVGFLKINNLLEKNFISVLKDKVFSDIKSQKMPYKMDSYNQVYRLDNVYDRSDCFKDLIKNYKIIQILSRLLGPNIVFCKNRHNHATLNKINNDKLRLHRDVLQWSRNIISIIIYLENTDENNGCTRVIPGSHYLPFIGTPNNGGTWMDEHSVYQKLVNQSLPVPMSEGDALILDSLVFHSTGKNSNPNSLRPIITLGYHSIDELSFNMKDDLNKVLICGEWIYRGNDIK